MVDCSLKFSICLGFFLSLSLNLSLRSSTNSSQGSLGQSRGAVFTLHETAPWMLAELSPGAAFLCCLPFPINSQCRSLIVSDIMSVLMILGVCITQRCSATCLLPITKKGIEIIILCVTRQIWLCLAAMPFESMPVLFLLRKKSLTATSQVLDDAGGCIWATRRRLTRLGITAGSQVTSIRPGLLQGKGQDEGCKQEIIRINAPGNSTNRNRLCRKYTHRDTSGNVHGDFMPAAADHRAILCEQSHLLVSWIRLRRKIFRTIDERNNKVHWKPPGYKNHFLLVVNGMIQGEVFSYF